MFLDVNCQDFNEEMWPSRLVQQAANIGKEEESIKIRKEQEEKCRNAKKKCVDDNCQEKANLKLEPHLKCKYTFIALKLYTICSKYLLNQDYVCFQGYGIKLTRMK